MRKYNEANASEVASMVPGPKDSKVWVRDINLRHRAALLNTKTESFHWIPISPRSCDSLLYGLFVLYCQKGWRFQLLPCSGATSDERGSVKRTLTLFYAYKFYQRHNKFIILPRSDCLFQQNIVNQNRKGKVKRLKPIWRNQKAPWTVAYS